jgi:hypothetical protein
MKAQGEHKQTALPMADCRRMRRFREWKRLSWRLLVAGALLGYLAVDSLLENPCKDRIMARHSQDEIEEMVGSVDTPLKAFTRIEEDIVFYGEHDARFCHCSDRWTSLRETYALGSGDCEDGAIAFAAMLHDDARYQVRVVQLMGRKKKNSEAVGGSAGHAIAIYRENSRWGWVSFNDWRKKRCCWFSESTYETIREAVAAFNGGEFSYYRVVALSKDDLLYGYALQDRKDEKSFWKKIAI